MRLVNSAGTTQATSYYYPFGGNRGAAFSTLTTKRFTGQYHESALPGGEGLSFYNARWYDAKLGRFVSADTIVPDACNPQAFNRYSYVVNNPLRFSDPSGHKACERTCPGDNITHEIEFGSAYEGDWNIETQKTNTATANQVAATVVDFTPGYGDLKGFGEVFTGIDMVSGEELGGWRWLGLIGLSEMRNLRHTDDAAKIYKWLGRGAGGTGRTYSRLTGQGIYLLVDESDTVRYVGRGDVWARITRHAKDSEKGQFYALVVADNNLSYAEARGIEQLLIEYYGGLIDTQLINKRNGIGKLNPMRSTYLDAGLKLFQDVLNIIINR